MTALDRHGSKWNNLVIHERRLVLFLPCKSAQTSIKQALTADYDFATPDIIAQAFRGFRLVAAFRDPWERFASAYHNKRREADQSPAAFADWLLTQVPRRANQHFRPQVENWTTDEGRQLPLDDVIRVETLAQDWDRVWGGKIGHLNATTGATAGEIIAALLPDQFSRLQRFYGADLAFQETL